MENLKDYNFKKLHCFVSAVHIQAAIGMGVCQEVSQLEPTPIAGYIQMSTLYSSLQQATSVNGHEPNSIHFDNRI